MSLHDIKKMVFIIYLRFATRFNDETFPGFTGKLRSPQ
jgi:hypothetical protein